jgi:penicillin-binding protein 1A
VGFDDIRTLGETESGAHAALPIWIEFMTEALKQVQVMPFEIPDDIQFVRVDPSTGLLASDQGDRAVVELFSKGTEPTQSTPVRIDPTDFYKLDQVQDGQVPVAGVPR